jgi:hypothetical protein
MPTRDGRSKGSPIAAADRILYIIPTHHLYDQVALLIETLSAGGGRILLHPNPGGERWKGTAVARLVRDERAHVVRRPVRVRWGDASFFEALLQSYEEALEMDTWDWAVTLSGQDFPLRPPWEHTERLASNPHDAWLDVKRVPLDGFDSRPDFGPSVTEVVRRHAFSYWFIQSDSVRRVPVRAKHAGILTYRKAADDILAFGVRTSTATRLDRQFGEGLHVGSSWMDLRRHIVEHVVRRIRAERPLRRFSRWTLFPEETVLPSLVMESALDPNPANDNRYVYWREPESGRTAVITPARLQDAFKTGAFLGRKFDFRAQPDVARDLMGRLTASSASAADSA